ncbi:ABC transporter [Cutibacterium acnes]|nr:ABC transporter [Cutibacterium acnes]REB17287.1 ABC transporter [Cutibacterium acnes]TLG08937.1 ABC transporter [Cutibacterium acnes]TLG18537.1 ABC transporter [Cutibacterium acnes]TLG22602.1 ABC transporter [Cutibacterium acnes]
MLSRRRRSERRALGYEDKQREESNSCRCDPSGHLSRRNWVGHGMGRNSRWG